MLVLRLKLPLVLTLVLTMILLGLWRMLGLLGLLSFTVRSLVPMTPLAPMSRLVSRFRERRIFLDLGNCWEGWLYRGSACGRTSDFLWKYRSSIRRMHFEDHGCFEKVVSKSVL
jgi:hypothetical protein